MSLRIAITSDPLSLLPLSAVSALSIAMIFSCLVLGQPWLTIGLLRLLVHHSRITSLLFSLVYSLCSPFLVSLSLSLSLTFFLELKALLFGLHSEKRYINIYMH